MRLRNIGAGVLSFCGVAAMLATAGSIDASAQQFQYIYGGNEPEAGRGGVRPVTTGGYIAAGESFTPSGGGSSDIYVVHTHDDGSLFWSQTYDINGNDSATDVEEVFYDNQGGFIITGVTEDNDCLGNRDIFLLRIDRCGNVIWLRTYGTPMGEEIGWDVIETNFGPGVCGSGAQPGDLVVAGSARAPGRPLDAYLLRADRTGNLLWARTYDGECNNDDYFYGVIEAQTSVGGFSAGDLVAVGGSNSWCNTGFGGTDAFIARVGGCEGEALSFAIYGGQFDDELRSVTEITQNANCIGNLAYTGFTDVFGLTGVIQRDVYLLESTAKPCDKVADLVIGHENADEGYCIREVLNGPDAGQLVVTGYMSPLNGLGNEDVFLQRLDPCGLNILPPFTRIFGGGDVDWGWSVHSVAEELPCRTDGYIVTGFTSSFNGGDQQLYLIKTDLNLKSGCNESEAEPVRRNGHHGECVDVLIDKRGEKCEPHWNQECRFWEEKLCYDPIGTDFCELEHCDCTPQLLLKKADALISFDEAGSVRSYPNPVTRGGTIALEYTMLRDGDASVTVSDITGRVVYTGSNSFKAGTHTIPVSTEGWGVGTYVVKLSMGDRSATTRVIVIDR